MRPLFFILVILLHGHAQAESELIAEITTMGGMPLPGSSCSSREIQVFRNGQVVLSHCHNETRPLSTLSFDVAAGFIKKAEELKVGELMPGDGRCNDAPTTTYRVFQADQKAVTLAMWENCGVRLPKNDSAPAQRLRNVLKGFEELDRL